MIVEPDFLNHWKTKLLIQLTNDKSSPLLVIRLWGFCQQRHRWILDGITPEALKAITLWEGDPHELVNHLKASGFLDEEKGVLKAHDWEVVNHQLIVNWSNGKYGKLGGRPKSSVQKPIGLPKGSQRVPSGPPIGTPIGEDRIGEDKTKKGQEVHEGFKYFWSAYPRLIKRAETIIAWNNLKPDYDLLQVIVKAVNLQKQLPDWNKDNGKFIPSPDKWLNTRRWEDEIFQKKSFSPKHSNEEIRAAEIAEVQKQYGVSK